MSRDDLFAQAFGGKEAPEVAAKGGKGTPPDARTELFKQAFPVRKEPDLQAPLLGTSFRFNMSRVAKLSFDEQMSLQKYEGASIRDLPAWLIDGGYVNNLPADVMRRTMGADQIIAVDIESSFDTNLSPFGDAISGLYVLWTRIRPWGERKVQRWLVDGCCLVGGALVPRLVLRLPSLARLMLDNERTQNTLR